MATIVTLVISILAGAVVISLTAPAPVAIATVCSVILAAFIGYRVIKKG
jgi:hypothetical protein